MSKQTEDTEAAEDTDTLEQQDNTEVNIATVEALLFAYGEPIDVQRLASITRTKREKIEEIVTELEAKYKDSEFGFELVRVAKKIQLRTKPQYADVVRALKASRPKRLSGPALETLAIVAYRQPIVKSDIEKLRGVDATPTIKTLLERDLIRIIGYQPTVGQPALYGTTESFLKMFGLESLAQLPTIRDLTELEQDPGETEEEEEELEHESTEEPEAVDEAINA